MIRSASGSSSLASLASNSLHAFPKSWPTPWHTVAAALLAALTTGFAYSFSTYSPALRTAFDFSQDEEAVISNAIFLVNLIAFSAGIVLDYTSTRFCCILSSLFMGISWGVFGMIAGGYAQIANPLVAFSCLGASGTYGASFMTAVVFSVLTKNFYGRERSLLIGLAKAWVGISAGVATAIFAGLQPSEATDPKRLGFLYMVAILTGVVSLCAAPVLRPREDASDPQPTNLAIPRSWRIPFCFVITLTLIMATAISSFVHVPPDALAIALICIVLSPLLLITPDWLFIPPSKPRMNTVASELQALLLLDEEEDVLPSPWETGPCGMMMKPEAYLLWLITLFGFGGGVYVTSNLGVICGSRSGTPVPASKAVVTFSCAQALGRLVGGSISDVLVQRGSPRVLCFAFVLAVMAVGHGAMCIPGPLALYVGVILIGCSFGVCWPLQVLAVGELFGAERFASNYMIQNGTPAAMGSLLFANMLATTVYKRHADATGDCFGDQCFELAHQAMVIVQLLGVAISILLSYRSQEVYDVIGNYGTGSH